MKNTKKRMEKSNRIQFRFIFIVLAILAIILIANYIVFAVNSDQWSDENSARVYLNWKPSSIFAGITQRNYIHVYAFEGDTIALGTNVYNAGYNEAGTKVTNPSHLDDGSVDIVLYDLENNPTSIDIKQNGDGHIKNVATEKLAKSMISSKGNGEYKPFTYTVKETGVYTIEFRSYGGTATTGADKNKNQEWDDASVSSGLISAWDVSVFDENDEKKPGRAYTDYLSLQTGRTVRENYYVLTNDNYIYKLTFNGVFPYTYNIFANNRGIIDNATGNILYKSVKDTANTNSYSKMGATYQYPGGKETEFSKSFQIFFEEPNKDLEGYLYEKAFLPEPATNVRFLGSSIDSNSTEIIEGMGGYFAFDVTEATTATLRIEFNIKGADYKPVEISDAVKPYATNYFKWDGKDGNGTIIPAKDYTSDEIVYTVITKAGEAHFPVLDMEGATEGISITRVSHIYNSEGNQVDIPGSIYDATKSVVYYDETAIYYGENAATTGISEDQVDVAKNKFTTADGYGDYYFAYNNSTYTVNYNGREVGEKILFNSNYAQTNKIRMGDHSHTTNIIDYEKDYDSQKEKIDYLDSNIYPVGLSSGGSTTTDYAIANYWTFIPANKKEANTNSTIKIKSAEENKYYNLISRVFYDVDEDGVYDPQADSDYLLSDVTVKLYKDTDDMVADQAKEYVKYDGTTLTPTDYPAEDDVYELVKIAKTPLQGTYTFEALEYKETGTKYLYQVIPKDKSYRVTSEKIKGNAGTYGQYNLYGYDPSAYGKEIQVFTVGGTGAIPNKNNDVTTINVGYYFDVKPYELRIKKNWDISKEHFYLERITPVVFEISYNLDGQVGIYNMRALSRNQSEANTYAYLETEINGKQVTDYYISAEYYIYQDKIFKHKYNYSETNATYQSFVAEDYYFSLSDYYKKQGWEQPENGVYKIENIPDFNEDGSNDWSDFSAISNSDWEQALPAGTEDATEHSVIAPFNSVIDRNVGTATTEISITNASEPGTIEILKYTGEISENKFLSGATFRLYEGDMNTVKQIIDNYNTAQINLNNATPETQADLKAIFDEASKKVDEIQIDSRTTRRNGRVAFSGLNPENTYTVRERFAPSGYRIVEEYYQVDSKNSIGKDAKFGTDNYYLLNVGNSEATGNLEIRKQIQGRAWRQEDAFSFDIAFNYNENDKSGIDISKADLSLFSTELDVNVDELISNFLKKFETTEDIIINNDADYVENSADTKLYKGLLNSGVQSDDNTSNTAKLKGTDFPVAGLYTFTIRENELETDDPSLRISPKVFTIAINVVRTFNSGVPEGETETLNNTHLEASISKITVQDVISEGEYGETSIYAGNTPTFVNNYIVEAVEQKTKYVIKKDFIGREWSDTDEFTFILNGEDETTKEALRNQQLKIEASFNKPETDDPYATEKTFTISKNTPNHEFTLDKIDFQGINFPVEIDENGNHITKPLVYTITIKEKIPEEAENNLYKGITYSDNIYTLKMILENSTNEKGETDGIIDKITLQLSNKNDKTTAECTINQRRGEDGEPDIVVTETHAPNENHIMTFTNKYQTNTISWQPIVRKTLHGRDWVENDNFRFAINAEAKTGVTLPSVQNLYIDVKPDNHSSRVDGSSFVGRLNNRIVFTAPGTYNFSIHEMFNNENGITVETSEFPIKVEIIDDKEGHLIAKYNEQDTNPVIEFVNTYTEKGQLNLEISKELKNRKWVNNDTFNFTIIPDEKAKIAIENKTLTMPSALGKLQDDKYTVNISENDEDLSTGIKIKNLGDIIVTKSSDKVDKYTFTIQEQKENLNQIECYNDKVILDVTVTRKTTEDGVPTGDLDIIATQSYASPSLESKIINNNKSEEVIETEESHVIQKEKTEEKITNAETYENNEPSEQKEEATKSITVQFVNYAYTEKAFDIEKILTGREWKTGEEFNAKVIIEKQVEDNSVELVGNDNLEKIPLTDANKKKNLKFKFYKEGLYTFNVSEIVPTNKLSGLAYDENVYTVNIKVTDNNDGKLTPELSIINSKSESINGETIQFNNVYTTGNLTIKNTVSGTTSDKEKEFKFIINLSDPTINETYGNIKFINGVATIKLKHGESMTALNLPTGITYTVEQEGTNKNGYETTFEGETGTITSEIESIAEFTNTRYISMKLTGGPIEFWIVFMFAIVMDVILAITLLKRRKT